MVKTKFYKDPARGQSAPYKPYVPQYQVHGVEPRKIPASTVEDAVAHLGKDVVAVSRDNPRTRPHPNLQSNVPYANVFEGKSPLGTGPLPNIGNNIETSWVGIDGEVYGDFDEEEHHLNKADLDPNHTVVDNNDDDEQNYQYIPEQIPSPIEKTNELIGLSEVDDDQCVLVIGNSVVKVDLLSNIQEEVKSLIFGEHPLNKTHNINPEDIMVLKKLKIKVGVFIE